MAHGTIVASRYWNTNGLPMAIVAVEGSIDDVAAYMGADRNGDNSEEATLRYVARYGVKLSREDALRMLPQLKDCGLSYRD